MNTQTSIATTATHENNSHFVFVFWVIGDISAASKKTVKVAKQVTDTPAEAGEKAAEAAVSSAENQTEK